MREARYNVVTGAWTLVASDRAHRPHDAAAGGAVDGHAGAAGGADRHGGAADAPPRSPTCPFCPGNEVMLVEIVRETGDPSGAWLTRVVANRYAAVTPDAEMPHGGRGEGPGTIGPEGPGASGSLFPAAAARGLQEVFVEGPRHDLDFPDLPAAVGRAVVMDWRERFRSAARRLTAGRISLFRNRGSGAGMSLAHPHSQLLATTIPSPARDAEDGRMRAYHAATGRCLLCDVVSAELRAGVRVVARSDAFAAFVPWAPGAPGEVWVVPLRHRPSFGETADDEVADLAKGLGSLLGAVCKATEGGYNLVVHSATGSEDGVEALHWRMEIRPRRPAAAGYEIGSGNRITGTTPQEDAERLRTALGS